jgi:tryptophanyl-tRNA synthetase
MGETFVIPKASVQNKTQYIPGTDGQKMSKSKENTLNIFLNDKVLRKQVMKIQTDSTPLEEPKDPSSCNVFALYELLANAQQVDTLRQEYLAGGMGYGHAKQALYGLILERFAKERQQFNYFLEHPQEIEIALAKGADRARDIANEVLLRVRNKVGY